VPGTEVPSGRALLGLVTGLTLVAVPAVLWLAPAEVTASAPVTTAAQAPDPAAQALPIRVRLGGIDVEAPVVPVGVDGLGEMELPQDVRTVGWYRFGPAPGAAAGSSVLSGHVDDRVQGRGTFYRLTDLEAGDPVSVELADGTQLEYRVRTVERIDKDVLPGEEIFDRTGPPRLTLVTCGGDFDWGTRKYQDNVVVTARPG
jgi:LPXTG-site transpeptidase (sortase) family protein